MYAFGVIMLLRPFEVWLAAYTMLQVIERKDISTWVNCLMLGINAFATLTVGYMLFIGKNANELIGNNAAAALLASSVVIWIYWLFIGIFSTISNNSRGMTLSTSRYMQIDRIVMGAVSPISFLAGGWLVADVMVCRREEIMENNRVVLALIGGICLVIANIMFIIWTIRQFDHYIVFGKKTVEVWNGNRGKVYKYSQLLDIKEAGKGFLKKRFKVSFDRDGELDTVFVDDNRIETIREEIKRISDEARALAMQEKAQSRRQNGQNGRGRATGQTKQNNQAKQNSRVKSQGQAKPQGQAKSQGQVKSQGQAKGKNRK